MRDTLPRLIDATLCPAGPEAWSNFPQWSKPMNSLKKAGSKSSKFGDQNNLIIKLGGGFKYFLFSSLLEEMIQFD